MKRNNKMIDAAVERMVNAIIAYEAATTTPEERAARSEQAHEIYRRVRAKKRECYCKSFSFTLTGHESC